MRVPLAEPGAKTSLSVTLHVAMRHRDDHTIFLVGRGGRIFVIRQWAGTRKYRSFAEVRANGPNRAPYCRSWSVPVWKNCARSDLPETSYGLSIRAELTV